MNAMPLGESTVVLLFQIESGLFHLLYLVMLMDLILVVPDKGLDEWLQESWEILSDISRKKRKIILNYYSYKKLENGKHFRYPTYEV